MERYIQVFESLEKLRKEQRHRENLEPIPLWIEPFLPYWTEPESEQHVSEEDNHCDIVIIDMNDLSERAL